MARNQNVPAPTEPPEQKLGDTPVAPWEMPTPEQKADVQPLRRALTKALSQVDSEEQADHVAQQLVTETPRKNVEQAPSEKNPGEKPAAQAAREVERTTRITPRGESVDRVVHKAVTELEGTKGSQREALAEAMQEVFNPEQQGAPPDIHTRRLQLLRRAVIKRMQPMDALDAELFLAVNHLPHTRLTNGFFYLLTIVFSGGSAWFGLMGLATLLDRKRGWHLTRTSALPLVLATSLVEYPIKAFFRRRRPFSQIVQAIVIGKKPGTWSFPSGHSAAAFAGAWLLGLHFPRMRWLLNLLAGLVAFSRIYLGDHYPSDVVSGSLGGILLAQVSQRVLDGLFHSISPTRKR